jgi:type IV pilus assembly protein PilN
MIQINLLPGRSKRTKGMQLDQYFAHLYCASFALLCLTIVFLWISQNREIDALNKRLAKIQQEVERHAMHQGMLKDLTAKKDAIDKKQAVIKDLQKDRDALVRVLALLSAQIPAEKVWLERLVHSANTVTVDGMALDNEAIAEFMRNIESSPYTVDGTVSIMHSRQILEGDSKLRQFQVNYRFLPFSQVQQRVKMQPR